MAESRAETPPRILDGVTLRHFGAIESLALIDARVVRCYGPRWTEAVRSEILAGMDQPECANVLAAAFLGTPIEIAVGDMAEVFRLRSRLSNPRDDTQLGPLRNLGEAESIFVADQLHGSFVTDDGPAHDFAVKCLGPNRVLDTVDLLREAVAKGELEPSEAQQAADAIRNSGRHLRRCHPSTFTAAYFTS